MKPVYIVEPHADTAELEKALLVEDGFDVRLVPDLVAANGLLRSADIAGILVLAVGPATAVSQNVSSPRPTRWGFPWC